MRTIHRTNGGIVTPQLWGAAGFAPLLSSLALATLGFAGNQIRLSNAALADEQGGERVFTDLGWTLKLTLAELRSAQQAYVADGQDGEYWASQVEIHLQAVLDSLDNLKRQVSNPDTLAALNDAVAAVGDIRDLDEEARGYVGSDQPLQASDLIFTRGFELVARAGAHVQAAQQEERTSRLDVMSTARASQSRMMWTAVVVIVLSMLVLAPSGASSERDSPPPDDGEYHVPEANGLSLLSLDADSGDDELDLPPVDSRARDGGLGLPGGRRGTGAEAARPEGGAGSRRHRGAVHGLQQPDEPGSTARPAGANRSADERQRHHHLGQQRERAGASARPRTRIRPGNPGAHRLDSAGRAQPDVHRVHREAPSGRRIGRVGRRRPGCTADGVGALHRRALGRAARGLGVERRGSGDRLDRRRAVGPAAARRRPGGGAAPPAATGTHDTTGSAPGTETVTPSS